MVRFFSLYILNLAMFKALVISSLGLVKYLQRQDNLLDPISML